MYLDGLFTRAGFPEGAFITLLIGSREVDAVIKDPRIKAVTLTGSEPAGRAVASSAAAEVKKAVLELGGSDPFIVMPSADLDGAVKTAVTARTQNNGQSCIAGKRFIVHADVYDAFSREVRRRDGGAEGRRPARRGDPGRTGRHGIRSRRARRAGRRRARQGRPDPDRRRAARRPGWFYPPTVVAGVTPDMRLHLEEAFGPVATLYKVADAQEAIEIANGTTFGLSSAAWTTDADEQELFSTELEAGGVFLNGMTISYPELPFGGIKNSGYGRELARRRHQGVLQHEDDLEGLMTDLGFLGLGTMGCRDRPAPGRRRPHGPRVEPVARRRRRAGGGGRGRRGERRPTRWPSRCRSRCSRTTRRPTRCWTPTALAGGGRARARQHGDAEPGCRGPPGGDRGARRGSATSPPRCVGRSTLAAEGKLNIMVGGRPGD